MPIYSPTGFLDVTNATLRGSKIVTTSNVGIANTNPLNTLSVGSNLQVEDTSSNVLTIRGNVAATAMTLGLISIAPSYSLEIVSNVGNTVSNIVQFTNPTTGFVSASNIEVGTANLFVDTTTSNVGIGTNTPAYTLDINGDINFSGNVYQGASPFISSLWTDGENSLYYRSNIEVGTTNLFVDTTTSNVGIGTNTPLARLDVRGDIITSNTVTQSNVPSFRVRLTTGSVSGTTNILYDTVDYDNTSSYTTIDGRFTAPVTGRYFFSAHGVSTNIRTTYDFSVDGTLLDIQSLVDAPSSGYAQCNISGVLYLTAGQYVNIYQAQGSTYGLDYNVFSGFFIG